MTYTAGGLIQATDYNGFASTTAGANINTVWSTGSGDAGYGQTALGTVATGATVTATQWSTLNNRITSIANHQGTTITSRTNPVATDTISILSNINTDLTNVTTNRGNAVSSGTPSTTWTGAIAKTTGTGTGGAAWTITFTNTVTFPSADQARYFWNGGGLIRIDMSKSNSVTDSDPDWNTFVGTVGTLYLSGRVNSGSQNISGVTYTGLTRIGGSGTPAPNLTTTGWYTLVAGTATSMFTLTNATAPYTGDYINVSMTKNAGSTAITITTSWVSAARAGAGETTVISGGTDTASPYTSFGTAPAVLVRYIPPETTYLTNTWGTPTIAGTVT